jgi:hypothetical protein
LHRACTPGGCQPPTSKPPRTPHDSPPARVSQRASHGSVASSLAQRRQALPHLPSPSLSSDREACPSHQRGSGWIPPHLHHPHPPHENIMDTVCTRKAWRGRSYFIVMTQVVRESSRHPSPASHCSHDASSSSRTRGKRMISMAPTTDAARNELSLSTRTADSSNLGECRQGVVRAL